jgi:hypothetical protein
MKFISKAVIGFSALALSVGAAWADNKDKDATFRSLDRNKDGYITPAEARGKTNLSKDFNTFDLNNDGKLNHAEYVAAVIKDDAVGVKDKVVNKVDDMKRDNRTAANTSTAPARPSTPMAEEKRNPAPAEK